MKRIDDKIKEIENQVIEKNSELVNILYSLGKSNIEQSLESLFQDKIELFSLKFSLLSYGKINQNEIAQIEQQLNEFLQLYKEFLQCVSMGMGEK